MPREVTQSLEVMRHTIDTAFPPLVDAARGIDPTLEKPVESTRNQMEKGLAHVEKRLLAKLKQQNEVTVRQLAHARNAILPRGRSQERVFNILQYLVRYGPGFVNEAHARCETWTGNLETASQL